MYLMYIDESGDTIPLTQLGKKFLVLTGAVIHEADIPKIEEKFRAIKDKYYQDPDIEIKSNFLRYANPDLSEYSPIKLNDRQKYDELEKDMAAFLKGIPVALLSVVIDKTIGIQVADLFYYPIFHMFEYDKKPGQYWRFDELSKPKLYKKDEEVGLKFFPPDTKKDLRFFN